MELPKNVKQIGESDRNCKIYVEDYVISYIKQMNQLALNKEMSVALYGIRKTEGNVTYLFTYGAAKLNFLQREVRHLSQAQSQEIEKMRRKYFQEQVFLGYCLLNGEMVEGFHICEQEICRYITGYAQFYEKNDNMLAYMLEARTEEAAPEVVDSQKYDSVKRRQEERKIVQSQEMAPKTPPVIVAPTLGMRGMRVATVAVFGLLCLIGLATLGEGTGTGELQDAARQVMSSLTEQKIPDAEAAVNQNEAGTLIAEDKLTEALQQENAAGVTEAEQAAGQENAGTNGQTIIVTPMPEAGEEASASNPVSAPAATSTPAPTPTPTPAPTPTPTPMPAPSSTPTPAQEPVAYMIKEGDTLIGISLNVYGTDARVAEICSLNQISNPDDIKIGQKILLPE